MISNYVLRTKVDNLKKRKSGLSRRKSEIQQALVDCGVSKNQAYKINQGLNVMVADGTILNRQRLIKELKNIEDEFRDVNASLRECHIQSEAETNGELFKIFKEIFTQDQIIEIKEEAQRRISGEPPMKVSFSVKDAIEHKNQKYKYRELAKDQLEKMIEFRLLLTGMIEEGCSKFGDSEFLKFISPLNRLIIPLQELEKIKRQNLL
jgi:hypothetical protein